MYSVYDIETLKGLFLYVSKNLQTGKVSIFRIDKYKNDLYTLVKYLQEEDVDYLVSFNGLSFDSQVVQFILSNFEDWADVTGGQIAAIIYQFAQDRIDDAKYNLPAPYKEKQLWKKQIDLYRIHHYDNDARRCSLKWLEFSMDFPNIEEIPFDHTRGDFTEEEAGQIITYCVNDVDATEALFKITRGETTIEEYTGKDKIQDRIDIMAEFELSEEAMNWSDVRIGDEINKLGYCKAAGLTSFQVYDLKRKRRSNVGFTFGDCIPEYVVFKTPQFQAFLENIRNVRVNLNEDQEFPLELNGTLYMIKKGGIHSSEKKRMIVIRQGELLLDADVGSQYPNAIVKRGLYPSHLGPKWLLSYKRTINLRLLYKQRSQEKQRSLAERRKYKGLAEMLKLALNGGGFGKTNERNSWQYDPRVHFSCTIGNQFEMLMLIEELELDGIHVISANTDGIVCTLSQEKESRYYEICAWWEEKVGNSESGKLEFTYYHKLIQTSVNDYLAIKSNGEVKKKGDFTTSSELHKNKSRRVVPIAIEQYFLSGTPLEKSITSHANIFDFCIGVKASKDFHYETVDQKTGVRVVYHRTIRYYNSTEGKKLLKIKNRAVAGSKGSVRQSEAGTWLSTVYNVADGKLAGNIDYSYYIAKASEIVCGLENPALIKKSKKVNSDPHQLSMF